MEHNNQIHFPGLSIPSSADSDFPNFSSSPSNACQLFPHFRSDNAVYQHCSSSYGSEETMKTEGKGDDDKETKKQHRYAFQTKSQVDILDDGYRWQKYGQKTVKNSKFPRSYYRCTYQGCNVKKQVQRLSKDEEVVVTTYDGIHTHPANENSPENFEQMLRHLQTYTA